MKRLFNLIKALWNKMFDTIEDPEMMIDLARREMTEVLLKNKERAVQAVTQRNRLQMMVDQTVAQIAKNNSSAEQAVRTGNDDAARLFLRDKATNTALLAQLQDSLRQADVIVDQVKTAIKNQESEARKKAAEALAMKARYKGAQVQNAIMKALDGMDFENQLEGFGAAKEKIDGVAAEASARSEMYGESFAGRVATFEADAADIAADAELEQMRARLGMPATTSQPATASAELENRLASS